MHSRWPVLLAVLGVYATSAVSQTAEDQMRAEPKLQVVFSRKFDALPMSDLLAAIAKDTGVNIAAGNRVANDVVVLVVKDKSYFEVLLKIAEHFGFTWQVQTAGTSKQYLLTQSSESVAAEAKLRAQQELARIEPIRKAIAKEAALTDQDLSTYRSKLLEWYRQEPKVDWEKHNEAWNPDEPWRESPEERAYREWQAREEGEFAQYLQPDRRAVVQFISTLGDREWVQLASGTPLSFCTTPRPTQGRLPISWVASTREWLRLSQEPFKLSDPPEGPEQGPITAEQRLYWDTRPNFSRALEADLDEIMVPQKVAIVSVTLYVPNGGTTYFGYAGRSGLLQAKLIAMDANRTPLHYAEYSFGAEGRHARLDRAGDNEASVARKDYSGDPVLGKPVKVPALFRGLDSLDEGEQAASMMSLLQGFRKQGLFSLLITPVRHAIADSAGVCLISDAYVGPAAMDFESPFGPAPRGEQQVGRLLDSMKASGGHEWKLENDWITLRTSDWAYWRPRQIPSAVYARLQNVGYGAEMSFDELVQLATSLTEDQFEGSGTWMLTGFLAQSRTASSLQDVSSRSILRMWGGLSAAQRNVLLTGGRVPLQVMTPAARDAIHTLIKRHSAFGGVQVFSGWGDDEDTPELTERSSSKPGEAAPSEPYDWTEYIPDKTPMPVAVSLEKKTTNGFYMAATMGADKDTVYRMELPESQFAAMMVGMEDSLEEMSRFGVGARFGRVVSEDYHFRVHLTPEVAIAVRVGVSREVPNSLFDPKNPPPDVKQLIEKSKADRERMMREYEVEEP